MKIVTSEKTHIPALDGWRGLAILLVIADHAGESVHSSLVHKLTRLGATGVGIFFALSGFLITSRLLAEHDRTGKINLKKFYIRRFFRLMPPSLVYLSALGVLTALGVLAVTKNQLLASLFFFRNYIPALQENSGWFTAHFWSLNVEEHFYLFWPFLLILTRRRVLVPVLLACSVAVWRVIDLHAHVVHIGAWPPGRTDLRLDSLLWGCILAVLMSQPEKRALLGKYLPGLVMVGLLAVDIVSNVIHGKHDYSPYEPVILSLLVVWPILKPETLLAGVLEWGFLKWIGRLSYSLYIWQQLWLLFPGDTTPFGRFQTLPLNIAVAFLLAALSYYFIEKPMINLGHRLTGAGGFKKVREDGPRTALASQEALPSPESGA